MSKDRLHLGGAAILTLSSAAKLLPVRDSEARAWLRARGLVRSLEGRDVVIWADVVRALSDAPIPPSVH